MARKHQKILNEEYEEEEEERVTIITIPVTSPGENDEDVYNAVMNVEEFLAEHNIRDVANFVA